MNKHQIKCCLNNKTRKYYLFRHILSVLAFMFWICSLHGQESDIKFDRISLEQGLSQSTVYSILQDSKGFMWFATLDGLNKYNGYEIIVYRTDPNNPYSLADNSINTLFEDEDRNLWIGTRSKGLCLYNKIKDNFITISNIQDNDSSLSNNTVTCIFQDSRKTIWIGTSDGLNKLMTPSDVDPYLNHPRDFTPDKWRFVRYRQNPDNIHSMSNNHINVIAESPDNRLWIGTNNGLCLFDPETEQFSAFFHKQDEQVTISDNTINALAFDTENNIWIGTNKGLNKLSFSNADKDFRFTRYYSNPKDSKSLSDNVIQSLFCDASGDVWFGTQKGGLNKLIKDRGTFSHYLNDPTDINSLSVNNVLCIYQDKSNVLWIGTSLGGLNKWNKTVEGLVTFRHKPYDTKSLNNSQVRSIYRDKNGDYWIGTVYGGLNKWDTLTNTFTGFKNDPSNTKSISNNHIRSMLEDWNGNFWIGTDGGGLNLMNRKTMQFKHYFHKEYDPNSITDNRIWQIYEDNPGMLWLATQNGLNKFNYKTEEVTAFFHNPNDDKTISDNHVTAIFEDSKGNFWIGTYGGGLNLMNRNTGEFTRFVYDSENPNSIGNNRIYSIIEDSDGILWIGAKGSLNRFDSGTKKFTRLTVKDDLPNNVIMGILEDRYGNLWISTNGGIAKYNKESRKVRNYDIKDGLQSNEFLVGAFFKNNDGKMFFGGINGFNVFYPDNMKDNPYIPEVAITRFQVFNRDALLDTAITEKKQLLIEYDQDVISFEFVALNYIFPEKNRYAYIMEGFDQEWNYVGNRRFTSYINLPPGEYVFKVKGSNNNEVWNEEGTAIRLVIAPPFWQTTWFYILAFVSVISFVVVIIKIRERNLQHAKKVLEETVKERTAEIIWQRDEIAMQRDIANLQTKEISKQKKLIEHQWDVTNRQKEKLEENITYASYIQEAILTPEEFINKVFPEHFILYKPKDVVSGDYYWMTRKEEKIFLTVADCTGHGVSGAFMSMLGIAFLNSIMYKHLDTEEKGELTAGQILDELRENIKYSLHKTGKENEAQGRVGMDIALCVLDKDKNTLQYAGAYNPLYLLRNKEFIQYKPDRMPIGFFHREKPFGNHEIELLPGDTFYIFSDGYVDQPGGAKKRRFHSKNFKQILIDIQDKDMKDQKEILNNTFEQWRGDHEQVDDVLVMGIKISGIN